MRYHEITMLRPDLKNIPSPTMPKGFFLRNFREGDEESWVRINNAADRWADITRKTFDQNFGYDLPAMKQRCLFLHLQGGADVGTSTAWYDADFHGVPMGRVHWVAIEPDYQGRGLAKPLLSATLERLAISHDRCYLTTASPRIPAVRLYLNYGFRPFIDSEKGEAGWAEVKKVLDHPTLSERYWSPDDL